MTIQELKKLIITTKRTNKDLSLSYSAILNQIEKATIGVKNAESDEKKLLVSACKKELKEQEQSKSSGAPYSQTTINVCNDLIKEYDIKKMSESEVIAAINELPNVSLGEKMKLLKEKYGETIDLKLANTLLKK